VEGKVSGEMGGVMESVGSIGEGGDEDDEVDMVALASDF
jgi:hypothetical protein